MEKAERFIFYNQANTSERKIKKTALSISKQMHDQSLSGSTSPNVRIKDEVSKKWYYTALGTTMTISMILARLTVNTNKIIEETEASDENRIRNYR